MISNPINIASIDTAIARLDQLGDGRDRSDLPYGRSYWVVPGRLLAGYFPGHLDADTMSAQCSALESRGIKRVVNLMESSERDHSGNAFNDYSTCFTAGAVACDRYEIVDASVPSVMTMKTILDAIDASLEQNAPVYVHCWGGFGRTGTAVGCWLMRHGHANAETVLPLISALRRYAADPEKASPENEAQRAFVLSWPQRA